MPDAKTITSYASLTAHATSVPTVLIAVTVLTAAAYVAHRREGNAYARGYATAMAYRARNQRL